MARGYRPSDAQVATLSQKHRCPIHHLPGTHLHSTNILSFPDDGPPQKSWRRFVRLHWPNKLCPETRSYNDSVASCVAPFLARPAMSSDTCTSRHKSPPPVPPSKSDAHAPLPPSAASATFSDATLVNPTEGDSERCRISRCAAKKATLAARRCSAHTLYDPTPHSLSEIHSPSSMSLSFAYAPCSPALGLHPAYTMSIPTLDPIPHFSLNIPGIYEEAYDTPDLPDIDSQDSEELTRITSNAARQARMRRRKFRPARITTPPHMPSVICEQPEEDDISYVTPCVIPRL